MNCATAMLADFNGGERAREWVVREGLVAGLMMAGMTLLLLLPHGWLSRLRGALARN